MAMGFSAMAEEVIEWDELKKLELDVVKDIEELLNENELLLEELAESIVYGLIDDFEKEGSKELAELNKLVDKLIVDFRDKYNLSLMLDYHDNEHHGDAYDEVDGAFFRLGGVYEMTSAAKELKDIVHFDTKYWVHFG